LHLKLLEVLHSVYGIGRNWQGAIMKKPLLAGIGVVGACAACCAVPLALPLLSGLSAAGLAGVIGWDWFSAGAAVGAAIAAAGVAAGLGVWMIRRRRPAGPSCAVPLDAAAQSGGCGCAKTAL
jgi:hypothetical protein